MVAVKMQCADRHHIIAGRQLCQPGFPGVVAAYHQMLIRLLAEGGGQWLREFFRPVIQPPAEHNLKCAGIVMPVGQGIFQQAQPFVREIQQHL